MDRNQSEEKQLLDDVIVLIQKQRLLELRELLEEYHTIDILDIMENLEENMQIILFEVLPIDIAASIVEESGEEFFRDVFLKLDVESKKNILEQVSLGDIADILSELDEEILTSTMKLLSREDASELKEILVYEEESTGGIMSNRYIEVRQDMTAKETIEHMREHASDAETIYYIYVVDSGDRLVGVLSLRELIVARESTKIEDLMTENIKYVYDYEDREEAVRLVSKYNLVAIPVVDKDKKIKGIITVDDIIDVIEEEATEDMYRFAGTSEQERDIAMQIKNTAYDQVSSSISARIPGLILMLAMTLLSVLVFAQFDFVMNATYVSLIIFIPLIMSMGGNIATQSSAFTVMSLSNKDLGFDNVMREAVVGIITGIVCSTIVSTLIYFFIGDMNILTIVGLSLLINMVIGAMIGSFIPAFLKKINIDPSIISAPIMSIALDITGLSVYYIVSVIIL